MANKELAIFPLPLVIYPGGRLNLRIFEPRYLDMVRDCARNQTSFGICALLKRVDADRAPVCTVGTEVRLSDFNVLPDGLLGIEVTAAQRFHVLKTHVRHDGLCFAQVEAIAPEADQPVPAQYGLLAELVAGIYANNGQATPLSKENLDNASWVSFRLCELLPLELPERQAALELYDPIARLQFLLEVLPRFQQED
jgi:uncharacterized protein